MDTQDTAVLLSQLKGIHLPDAPIAPALWPVYLSLFICLIATLLFASKIYTNQRSWQREALSTLENIQNHQPADALQQTAELLKRIALTHETDKSIRHLHGEPWLNYLDRFYQTDFFSQGDGKIFGKALYQADSAADETLYRNLYQLIKRRPRAQ